MKNRLLITVTALLLAATPFLRAADEPKTPLGEKMEAIKKDYDVVKKAVNGGTATAETLALVANLKHNAEASLKEKPKNVALIPEADKAAFLKGYDTEMHQMIALFGKLETALKDHNNDAAKALITEIDAQQRKSHQAYRAKPKPATP